MMKKIRDFIKRPYKSKQKRLYIEAQYLKDFGFEVGQAIKYEVDNVKGQVTIVPTNSDTRNHVSETTQKTGTSVPVIDLKAEDVKTFFVQHKNVEIELEILTGKIIFTVKEAIKKQAIQNVFSFFDAKNKKESKTQYAVSVSELGKVVNYEQMSIFDIFRADEKDMKGSSNNGGITTILKEKAIKMLSLFSGSGTMDKGFLDEGYDIVFANDRYEKKALKDYHIQTYRQNIGDHIIMKDVLEFTKEDIPQVDFIAAGVPCVKFSGLNTKDNFRDSDSPTHPLVEQTINIIQWSNAKSFLIENVEKFISVKDGAMLQRFKERLPEFGIVSKIIDATSLGSAQKRVRSFIFGIKGEQPELELPHVAEFRTVKDALKGIDGVSQQDLHFNPTPKTLERMQFVPQGGNIKNVPIELRAPNKTFSNYCQRLAENKQAPTITHVQDDVFIHPTKDRYLTVRETARLFSLPDNFSFIGSLTSMFEMLKNAVDYRVSNFLAKTIKKQLTPILQ